MKTAGECCTAIFWLLLFLLLAGCQIEPVATIQPVTLTLSATPSPTPTATATPIWFPASATPSPFPTQAFEPTPEMHPNIGELLLMDDFSSGEVWTLQALERGTSALGLNELTIALVEPGAYLSTTRLEPYLADFYMEVTVQTSLCGGMDEYGLLLRAAALSDFYRFSLSCDGQMRLDLIRGGTASSPQTWISSSSVPRAAPASIRIGVWASGPEMRFFIGDAFQFSAPTPMIPAGAVGFFARSRGDNAVTVSFSDLQIWELIP